MLAVGCARVLVVDRHQPLAEGLALCLDEEEDLQVVGTATSRDESESVVASQRPDVVVIEWELGCSEGGAPSRRLRMLVPTAEIVMVGREASVPLALAAVRAGAAAFVTHDGDIAQLVHAVRSAARGEAWFPPRLLRQLLVELAQHANAAYDAQDPISQLSTREREVLECMVAGLDRATIAKRLFLAPNTVRTHVRNLLAKLGVHSSVEAIALAARAGVIGWHSASSTAAGQITPTLRTGSTGPRKG